jgi:hypothetical protein
MPTNNTGQVVKDLDARFPGRIAHLFAPGKGAWRTPFADYAIDNGAWGEKKAGRTYPHGALLDMLRKCEALELEHGIAPTWIACPDVVFEAGPTLELWRSIAPWMRALYGYKLALVVQDGMTEADVFALKERPDVIFVGGSTEWKWASLPMWTAFFPRVHVGRVNSPAKLWTCHALGVESIDGTGWAMATQKRPNQIGGLIDFLARTTRAA